MAYHRAPAIDPARSFPFTAEALFNLYGMNWMAALLALAPAYVLRRMREELAEAQEFGSYQLVARLGKGGMGEVWRARHRLLARPAAIKLIARELQAGDPSLIQRFEQEVQATAQLGSPHTITIFDYGVASDGTFYYVMELLDGYDLSALIREHGPVSPARAVFLLCQVLESLEEAHAAGLVHRDIKPENVFVCRLGLRGDFVKVLDFGLALLTRVPAEARLTGTDVVQGTPSFMAPEQALQKPVDGRADLYSVACLAYWLMTGKTVFEAATPVEHVILHATTPPPSLSGRGVDSASSQLESVLLRSLEKEPDRRPASAGEMRRELMACLPALPDSWTQSEADSWWSAQNLHNCAKNLPGSPLH